MNDLRLLKHRSTFANISLFSFMQNIFLDYGEKENSDLAERFGIKKEDFPHYKLFVQGRDPVDFTGDETKADEIKKFLIKETGKLSSFWHCHH